MRRAYAPTCRPAAVSGHPQLGHSRPSPNRIRNRRTLRPLSLADAHVRSTAGFGLRPVAATSLGHLWGRDDCHNWAGARPRNVCARHHTRRTHSAVAATNSPQRRDQQHNDFSGRLCVICPVRPEAVTLGGRQHALRREAHGHYAENTDRHHATRSKIAVTSSRGTVRANTIATY